MFCCFLFHISDVSHGSNGWAPLMEAQFGHHGFAVFTHLRSGHIFCACYATRSLREGVWFQGCPSQKVTPEELYQLAVACSDCSHC